MNVNWKKETDRYVFQEQNQHYLIKNNTVGTLCQVAISIFCNVLKMQRDLAKERFALLQLGQKLTVQVEFSPSTEQFYQRVLKEIENTEELKKLVPEICDLDIEQKRTHLLKAKEFAERMLVKIDESSRRVTSELELPDKFTEWHLYCHSFIDQFWEENGDFFYSFDHNEFKQNFGEDPLKIDCATFAFLHTFDLNFIWCFENYGTTPEAIFSSDYRKLLQGWYYYPVVDPKKFDLVVYEKDSVAKHYALYHCRDEVISKKGSYSKKILIHHISNVPTVYGNKFTIFRRMDPVIIFS